MSSHENYRRELRRFLDGGSRNNQEPKNRLTIEKKERLLRFEFNCSTCGRLSVDWYDPNDRRNQTSSGQPKPPKKWDCKDCYRSKQR